MKRFNELTNEEKLNLTEEEIEIYIGMEKILNRYAEIIDIEFITKQKYVKLIKNDKF